MWVRLKTVKNIEVQGRLVTRYPGDYVDVGKMDARLWIAAGDAEPMAAQGKILVGGGCGIVACGRVAAGARKRLQRYYGDAVEVVLSKRRELRFPRTLLWHPSLALRYELLPVGFGLLERWEAAAPLCDYGLLAASVGSEEDRRLTEAVVGDLRVMLYDPRLVFVRRCEAGERLLAAWAEEERGGGDGRLAFLRAVCRAKPLVNALPVTWTGAKGPEAG